MNITRAQIEISSRCNFKCITCKHGYRDYGEDLDPLICNKIIEDVIPDLELLELQGTGESLLNRMTENFVDIAVRNKTNITLITNGSLLTQRVMELLVTSGMQLVISLDGSNKSIYSKHRPVGNFDKIISNIHKLNDIRKSTNPINFSIVINMVLTRFNYLDIHQMIDLLSGLQVDFLFVSEVRKCMPNWNTWEEINLLSLSSTPIFNEMIASCKEHAMNRGIGFAFNPNRKPQVIRKKVCVAPWHHVFVAANGDVSVCCELSKTFGNLHSSNLESILSNKDIDLFRDNMMNGIYDPHCKNCCLPWGLPY